MSIDTGLPDRMKKNLEKIAAEAGPEENLDWVFAIEGEEGEAGKSALAQAIALEIEGDSFDPEKQIALDDEEFKKKARDLDPGSVLIFDEGVEGLMAVDTMTTEGRSLVKFLRKCRELNLIIIICMPVWMEMNKKIRKNRVKTLASARLKRKDGKKYRYALLYNKSQIRKSDLSSDKSPDQIRYPRAVFSVSWNDPRQAWPDLWNTYLEMKEGEIRDPEQEEEDIDLGQVVRIVKNRKEDYLDVTRGGERYIVQELIENDFEIGGRKASRVKKVVERDLGLRKIDQQGEEAD